MNPALQEPCQFEKMAELRGFPDHDRNFAKDAIPLIGKFSQLEAERHDVGASDGALLCFAHPGAHRGHIAAGKQSTAIFKKGRTRSTGPDSGALSVRSQQGDLE